MQKWFARIIYTSRITARISLVFILLGIAANIHAVRMNEGVMPVAPLYVPPYVELDAEHALAGPDTRSGFFTDWIAFETIHSVPAPLVYLAEWIHFPLGGYYVIASPGDILMWTFGATGLISAAVLFCCFFISLLQRMWHYLRT